MEKLGVFRQAVKDAESVEGVKEIKQENSVLYEYPDYEAYREIQTAGNKAKLGKQFVKSSHIELLSNYVDANHGGASFGLCHGTRGGKEQKWFSEFLAGNPEVIGTEISDTANQFDNTVQWDFHDFNPDWAEKADFIYSNSWDHAFDPPKAFENWIKSLVPGGLILLDHTKGHAPSAANALDPFGITRSGLTELFEENFGAVGSLLDMLDYSDNKQYRAQVLVFQKNG